MTKIVHVAQNTLRKWLKSSKNWPKISKNSPFSCKNSIYYKERKIFAEISKNPLFSTNLLSKKSVTRKKYTIKRESTIQYYTIQRVDCISIVVQLLTGNAINLNYSKSRALDSGFICSGAPLRYPRVELRECTRVALRKVLCKILLACALNSYRSEKERASPNSKFEYGADLLAVH